MPDDLSRLPGDESDSSLGRVEDCVDVRYYLSQLPAGSAPADPVADYRERGWRQGLNPCAWFDVAGYLRQNPDVQAAGFEPFEHYLGFGFREGRRWTEAGDAPHEVLGPYFDAGWYRDRSPDLAGGRISLLDHYIAFGWREGRSPCSWFSPVHYLQAYPDVAASGMEPFYHYLTCGMGENRAICSAEEGAVADLAEVPGDTDIRAEFDAGYYRSAYPDITGTDAECFEHFIQFGWREGRNPAAWFCTELYRDAHAELLDRDENPFVHYIRKGRSQDLIVYPAVITGGLRLKFDPGATLVADPALAAYGTLDYAPTSLAPDCYNPRRLRIHWVIPDFNGFSGGHSTIFNIARWLEFEGHDLTFWVVGKDGHETPDEVYSDVSVKFQALRAPILSYDERLETVTGDAVFATGWQTVPAVSRTKRFLARMYFVQDYEPWFFPMGSHAYAARLGYDIDLGCICASTWLSKKLGEEHGRWTSTFRLAVDRSAYFPDPAPRHAPAVPRIAVYARSSTPRRCVELAFLALEELARTGVPFEVVLFAADLKRARAAFPVTVHSYLTPAELGELYRSCELGISFSATNYSLVPQEMMACGLPVVELDSESSRAIFPPGVVTMTGPEPARIAADLAALLRDPERRARQRELAGAWIADASWRNSAAEVRDGILRRLADLGHRALEPRSRAAERPVRVTVCIPTFNGAGEVFETLEAVRAQVTPWPFEIVIVDSSSTDGSAERLASMPDVIFRSIPQSEFGHGKTRNLCASLGSGDFIAFLTQDAVPANTEWLYNLVTMLEHFPRAAGVFGRHLARPGASPLTALDLEQHFDGFTGFPAAMSRETDPARYASGEMAWRQVLHFYSDNNSCMRRAVWERVPYPDVPFGEDQVWADMIVRAGYQRVYAHRAVVYHSHDYTPDETRRRLFTEAAFFKRHFGYEIFDETVPLEVQHERRDAGDKRRIAAAGLDPGLMRVRSALNLAALEGARDGQRSVVG